MEYIDTGYKPGDNDLLTVFRVKPAEGKKFKDVAEALAGESSIGTWTDLSTMVPEVAERLKPHIYRIAEPYCWIAYPSELFESGSIPQILSSIAGNIYGMKAVARLRLVDFRLPSRMVAGFTGPRLGREGVRERMGIAGRPLIGTIVKPKVGLSSQQFAEVLYEAMAGGCDIVKDDENLTDQEFNRFEQRLELALTAAERAETETGERKGYMPNVTAPGDELMRRLELVKKAGSRYVMVDVVTTGFSGVQMLRNHSDGLAIHAHRAMYAAFTRVPDHGMSTLSFSKFCRFAGVDQLHVGTIVGKMEGDKEEILRMHEEMRGDVVEPGDRLLGQDWGSLRPVLSVASGGVHPFLIEDIVGHFGKDLAIMLGGGIHGHPEGTRAGARTARKVLDAALRGESVKELAEKDGDVGKAYELWGQKEW
ncbi:type III ribulose-bisphosphate carboxylase [candidate division WOR-3 bacterium]|uniref:Type III ribulose-bisphosphate carboxylase n=1 Tax=candidate division WOR-3 bacterium TaxID=2052148 RepID=A0A9D5K8F3_UNCW3|nr:type III ribulose-bisphosphate carboxylase [candidate division WOR-3 bacterium]MBD3363999.1 type III ribulose-bisphosphate carboxylase [candidate division WOR-3 bacterium]